MSTVAISKVLRNHPDVGEETRQRVLSQARKRARLPTEPRRARFSDRSHLLSVGLIVPDLLHPFFAEVAASISDTLRKDDYYLVVSSSQEDPELRSRDQPALARQLDALIITSCRSTVEVFLRIEKHKTPYVLIDRSFSGLSHNFVGADDFAAGMLATQHLVDIGCKRIAHIRGPETSPGIQRLEGYKRALGLNRKNAPDEYVIFEPKGDVGSRQRGADAMRQLLRCKHIPDGVFCFNDPLAMGAVNETVNQGLRIPEDIAIIGCGNLHYDDSLRVPLERRPT